MYRKEAIKLPGINAHKTGKSSAVKKIKPTKPVPSAEADKLPYISIYEQKLTQLKPRRVHSDRNSAFIKKHKQTEEELTRELKESRAREGRFEDELFELKKRGEEKERNLDESYAREHHLERKLQEFRQYIDQKDQAHADVSEQLEDVRTREKKLARGLNKLRLSSQRKEQLNETVSKELEDSRKRENKLEEELNALKRQSEKKDEVNLTLSKELDELRIQKEKMNLTLSKELDELRTQKEKTEGEVENLKKQIEKENKFSEEEVRALKEQIAQKDVLYADALKTIEHSRAKEQVLEGQLEKVRHKREQNDKMFVDALKQAFGLQNTYDALLHQDSKLQAEFIDLTKTATDQKFNQKLLEAFRTENMDLQERVNKEMKGRLEYKEYYNALTAKQASEIKLLKIKIRDLEKLKEQLKMTLVYRVNAAIEKSNKTDAKRLRRRRRMVNDEMAASGSEGQVKERMEGTDENRYLN